MKNQHNNLTGSFVERTDDRIKVTGEVFTPMELCHSMVSEIDEDTLKNPSSTFLDPSAGSGNFLLALQTELLKYHSLEHINNNMLYGVELMEDNHKEMCNRLGIDISHSHIVCEDALEYDYSFGEPVGLEAFM
tara:strand:- start:27 stop:425 length:399 start_codon:yes stop_codon:yes gene_type:complete